MLPGADSLTGPGGLKGSITRIGAAEIGLACSTAAFAKVRSGHLSQYPMRCSHRLMSMPVNRGCSNCISKVIGNERNFFVAQCDESAISGSCSSLVSNRNALLRKLQYKMSAEQFC